MIKEIFLKRILKMTLLLSVLVLFYIFPNNEPSSYDIAPVSSSSNYHDIFLLDKNGFVSKTTVSVSSIEKEKMAKDLLKTLVVDSENKNKIPEGFYAIIPKKTIINSIKVNNETISVDFSDKIKKTINKDKLVECIVYTLTSINGINKVYLTIDGKNKDFFIEVYDRSIGINKNIEIYNFHNLKTVNLYYISNNDNVNYYIPVTKYINDKRDRINIIY